ncbi:MAG: aminopeptidase P family protein [Rickettsiales bacterium]|nr:aminopeptidase P family protein [Rickettsiales bacterium]
MTIHQERLEAIRKNLRREGADGFILSNGDEFFSEYTPEHEKRLEWLTGFTGSAGTVIVLDHKQPERSAFFTDGRYTLQAKQEIDESLYEIYNSSEISPIEWLKKNAAGDSIAFDPWLVSIAQIRQWKEQARNLLWVTTKSNPVDELWHDRPAPTQAPAFEYPLEYAGQSTAEKVIIIAEKLIENGAEAVLLTQPESVNWLLNIRGNDIENTPLLLCRAIVSDAGKVALYADEKRLPPLPDNVKIYPADVLRKHLKRWNMGVVWIQPSVTPVRLYRALKAAGARFIQQQDPCTTPKAIKNETELKNIRETHLKDGLALTKFLHWLDTQDTLPTEMTASDQLEAFRKESPDFREPSFPTISGFGPNGAIVHYCAEEDSCLTFQKDNLYLVDSGGQYLGGTTDVTRTVAIGTPAQEMCENYTRVLQGHIAICSAIFPKGTNGNQLDSLARDPLWKVGLDYDHGTSHGVGCYMGVHEGPQGISKRSNGVALQAGMVMSNEPGYYKTGEYGIRIENLVEVVASEAEGFLTFVNLTCAPLDKRLVVHAMLTETEIKWWNDYHQWVWDELSGKLDGVAKEWLKQACEAL